MRASEAKCLLKTASPTLESGWTNQPPLKAQVRKKRGEKMYGTTRFSYSLRMLLLVPSWVRGGNLGLPLERLP